MSFSEVVAVPLNVDVKEAKEGPVAPNPVPAVTVKAVADPQGAGAAAVLCAKIQSALPPTLQRVNPLLFPTIVQVKVNVSPGQVGVGAVNCCPATSPGERYNIHKLVYYIATLN